MSILNEIFLGVLKSSLNASIIAVLIIIIKRLFHKKITPRIHHVLWLLVLVRLLIPFFPESNLSVLNFLYDHDHTVISKIDTIQEDSNNVDILNEDTHDNFNKQNDHTQLEKTTDNEFILFKKDTIINNKMNLLSLTWLSGFLFIAILILISTIRTKHRILRLTKITDVEILSILDICKKTIGIHKEIPLYTGTYFHSPCILGIMNTCIYYPQNHLDHINNNRLYHIFLHELAHFKRKDLLYNLVCVLTLSLHWFNPLIWFVIRLMKVDQELACDAYVLSTIGESEATSYGMTIIHFLENNSLNKNKPGLLYFNETSCKLERRIKMIKGFKKGSYKISMLTIVVGIFISSITLTDAAPTYNNDTNPTNSIHQLTGFDKALDPIYSDLNDQGMIKIWNKEVKLSQELIVEINGILADKYKSVIFYTVKSNNLDAYDTKDFDFNLTSKSPLSFDKSLLSYDKKGYIGGSGSWSTEENKFKFIDTICAQLDPVDDHISFSIDYLDDHIEPIMVTLPFTEDDFVVDYFEKDLDINIQKNAVDYRVLKIYASPMQTLLFVDAKEQVKDYLKQGNILKDFRLFDNHNKLENFEREGMINKGIFWGFQCFSPVDYNTNSLILQYEDKKHKIDLKHSTFTFTM
jgi:beta-lactamase regulating signal transducer with metallopeptidase domain